MKRFVTLSVALILLLLSVTAFAQTEQAIEVAPHVPPHLQQEEKEEVPLTNVEFELLYGTGTISAERSLTGIYGPDHYGYTYNDAASYSWIDARAMGVDLGLDSNNRYTTISLPFTVPYYDVFSSNLSISANGYATLWGTAFSSFANVPSPESPGGVIAPYEQSNQLSNVPNGPNRVYGFSGGTAPNRYYVVEWHAVENSWHDANTFQMIVYENGTIKFQYRTIAWVQGTTSSFWCVDVGIENTTGFDGLDFHVYCLSPSVFNGTAIEFDRPTTGHNVRIFPKHKGTLMGRGGTTDIVVPVKNIGLSGSDTFNLEADSSWPVTFYEPNGTTPLTDSNNDGKVDIGVLAPGALVDVVARMRAPSNAGVGSYTTATIRTTSVADASKQDEMYVSAVIPAPFAMAFVEYGDAANEAVLAEPAGATFAQVTPPSEAGINASIQELANGNFLYVWSKYERGSTSGEYKYDIEYTIIAGDGSVVVPITKLTNNSFGSTRTGDYYPVVAVAPNGDVGLSWYRYEYDSAANENRSNIYFAVIGQTGSVVTAASNVTGHTSFDSFDADDHPRVFDARVFAADNGNYTLAWTRTRRTESGGSNYYDSDIMMQVVRGNGTTVKASAAIANDTDTSGNLNYYEPEVVAVGDGNVLVAWRRYTYDQVNYSQYRVQYQVFSGNGTQLSNVVTTDIDDLQFSTIAGTRLGGDKTLLAAGTYATDCTSLPCTRKSEITYVLVDGTTNQPTAARSMDVVDTVAGVGYTPADLDAITDGFGRAILVWQDSVNSYRRNLHYAVVDAGGNVSVPPMLIYSTGYSLGNNSDGTMLTTFDSSSYWAQFTQSLFLPVITR